MSLHDLASSVTSVINPMMQCQWFKNTGLTTVVGGAQSPTYAQVTQVQAQVQQLTAADLKHMNNMNMSAITRKIWCNAILTGVDRAAGLGGDRVVLPDGTAWLVVQVIETWQDWSSALMQKQVA
jgi:hypothetical protein